MIGESTRYTIISTRGILDTEVVVPTRVRATAIPL